MLTIKNDEIQRLNNICGRIGKLAANQSEVHSNLLRYILSDTK